MKKGIGSTPFSEYREEQMRSKVNIFDYFVTPSFFDQFYDTKPLLIYGSRGSGKTTLFKALALSEAHDVEGYLKDNNYIGIYYRIDLNIMASFYGGKLTLLQWEKLFSYYFVSALCYEFVRQMVMLLDKITLIGEQTIAKKYGRLFSGKNTIKSLSELQDLIADELYFIRDYINNCANQDIPHIGDYVTIVRDLPLDLFNAIHDYDFQDKTVFYLIDEFEGLTDWQQRAILSLVKYSDDKHTFKICMRPDGLKSSETIGGEFISETDDIKSIDLNDKILNEKDGFYQYALDVCKKRIELFYAHHNFTLPENFDFAELFDTLSFDDEIGLLLKDQCEEINKEIVDFFDEIACSASDLKVHCQENYLDFLLLKLMYLKRKRIDPPENILSSFKKRDSIYTNYLHNYKDALLYQVYLAHRRSKVYSGFRDVVIVSGGTLRYLLEICNEIFEIAVASKSFSYEAPKAKAISYQIQTEAIEEISNKRLKQISAIPEIGLNIRTFIYALGKIFLAYHREERISKVEPNHFSIKSNYGKIEENINLFLRECVMRGVLIKTKNNKTKNVDYIGADEYLYVLHPIYTPSFHISWRRKQKMEFSVDEIKTLIGNDTGEIKKIIKKYWEKTRMSMEEDELDDIQLKLPLIGES